MIFLWGSGVLAVRLRSHPREQSLKPASMESYCPIQDGTGKEFRPEVFQRDSQKVCRIG